MVSRAAQIDRSNTTGDLCMLNASVLSDDVVLCTTGKRGRMLQTLVSEFQTVFAEIDYEIDGESRVVNAQAFGMRGYRFVRLYGGFAFHPLTSEHALVFALLHETGHHRARGRRFSGDPMLACDCLADKWAVGAGALALRRGTGRTIDLLNALDSMEAVIASVDVSASAEASTRSSQSRQTCWAESWSTRKSQLCKGNVPVPVGPCYYLCKPGRGG
jgi:hypothetical protein